MIKDMQLSETVNAVHFECTVHKWVCPRCPNDREYERERDRCLICESPLRFVEEQKFGWINKESEKWGCSCVFGSWFRWAGFWRDNYPEIKCKHYKRAFREWKKKKI